MSTYFEGEGVDPNPMNPPPLKVVSTVRKEMGSEIILPPNVRAAIARALIKEIPAYAAPPTTMLDVCGAPAEPPSPTVKVGKLYFGRNELGQIFIFDGVRGFFPDEKIVEAALQAVLDNRWKP